MNCSLSEEKIGFFKRLHTKLCRNGNKRINKTPGYKPRGIFYFITDIAAVLSMLIISSEIG